MGWMRRCWRLVTVLLGCGLALDGVFPTTAHQRCWNHRTLNVQAKLPKALHAEARRRLREMSAAPTPSECERLRDEYVGDLSAERSHRCR